MATADSKDAQSTLSELLTYTDSTTVGPEKMPVLTRLRDLRLRAAMTQAELAERSGVARTTIIRLEAGDPDALPPTVKKLARALHVKPFELWEENKEGAPRRKPPTGARDKSTGKGDDLQ